MYAIQDPAIVAMKALAAAQNAPDEEFERRLDAWAAAVPVTREGAIRKLQDTVRLLRDGWGSGDEDGAAAEHCAAQVAAAIAALRRGSTDAVAKARQASALFESLLADCPYVPSQVGAHLRTVLQGLSRPRCVH